MNPPNLKFSIIIPTYNRPDRLGQCLQSIDQLDYPRDHFEVIVVDDGSAIPLNPITDPFKTHLSLRLIRQPNAGPASARNTGAAAAQGHYLVFTDDDCQPDLGWLQALANAVIERPNALVGGHTVNALPQNRYSTASQLLIDYLYDYYNRANAEVTFFASNNVAVPRTLYQQLGGFDTRFPLAAAEDREFCDRWRYHGLSMHYAPAMQIHHAHALTLSSFWQQHFNYGRGAYYFHKIRSQRINESLKVEPIFFYFRLISYPFKKTLSLVNLELALLLFLSQIANASGFFWKSLSDSFSSDGSETTT